MKIDSLKVGYLGCNCYILNKDDNILVIDPGDEIDKILNKIGDKKVVGILITHHHFDHIGALKELKEKFDVPVIDFYNRIESIKPFSFKMIETTGHKEDLITYYFEEDNVMFTGDFLFKGTVGRTDLPGGNIDDMFKSIEKIKKYDDDITIYPGHGDITNLGYEKRNNIYFKGGNIYE